MLALGPELLLKPGDKNTRDTDALRGTGGGSGGSLRGGSGSGRGSPGRVSKNPKWSFFPIFPEFLGKWKIRGFGLKLLIEFDIVVFFLIVLPFLLFLLASLCFSKVISLLSAVLGKVLLIFSDFGLVFF